MCYCCSKKSTWGVTLIEMLMVLAIISIVASITLFYVNSDNFRLQSEARNMRSELTYAKAEAVKRNARTEVQLFSDRYEIRVVVAGQPSVLRTVTLNEKVSLKSETLGDLSEDDDLFEFFSNGTSEFNEVRMKNSSRNFSIKTNNTGRIFIEGPSDNI